MTDKTKTAEKPHEPRIERVLGLPVQGSRWQEILAFDAALEVDGKPAHQVSAAEIVKLLAAAQAAGRASFDVYGRTIILGAYGAFMAG